jgi:CRP/FNR family transcriptional regulator, anaerobic regulatory protein
VRHHFTARPASRLPDTTPPAPVFADQAAPSRAVGCAACRLASECLPSSLGATGRELLERLALPAPLLEKGASLHQNGSPFESLYVVQVGALKGIAEVAGGTEVVGRFYLPGEIIGLNAIDRGRFNQQVVALETSALCRIPYSLLLSHAATFPPLMKWLLRRISAEVRIEEQSRIIFASGNAPQVLARTLIDLGERFAHGGLSATRLRLPMSRCELGSYLGLTPETMSRLFRRFTRQRLIAAARREIELLDVDGLRRLASCSSRTLAEHARPASSMPRDPGLAYAGNRA